MPLANISFLYDWVGPNLTTLYCSGIFLIFWYSRNCHLKPIRRLVSDFDRAWRKIAGEGEHSHREESGQSPTAAGRERLRGALKESPFGKGRRSRDLSSQWTSFWRDWNEGRVSFEGRPLESDADVCDYFDKDSLLARFTNMRAVLAVPGALVGLGILGTFLGLVLGLADIDVSTSAQLLDSVRRLISGLRTAFMTSLFGIFFSLLYIRSERSLLHGFGRSLRQFQGEALRLFPVFNPEKILGRMLEQETHQLQILKTLGTDVATVLTDAFDKTVEERLAPHMKAIADRLDAVTEVTTEAHVQAINEISTEFVKNLDQMMGNQFRDLAESIAGMQESFKDLDERFEETARRQMTVIEQTNEAAEVIGGHLPEMLRFGEGMQAVSETLKRMMDQVAEVGASLTEDTRQVQETQRTMAESLGQSNAALQTVAGELSRVAASVRESNEALLGSIETSLERFDQGIHAQMEAILQSFDSKLAEVLQRFSSTLLEIRESVEGLQEYSSEMSSAMSKSTEEHADMLREMSGDLKEILTRMTRTVGEVAPKLDAINSKLSESAEFFSKSLEESVIRKIEEINRVLDEHANAFTEGVAGTLAAQTEQVKTARSMVSEFQEGLATLRGTLQGFMERFDASLRAAANASPVADAGMSRTNHDELRRVVASIEGNSDRLQKMVSLLQKAMEKSEQSGGFIKNLFGR